MPTLTFHACPGCDRVTSNGNTWVRFRGSRWCKRCHAAAKAGQSTPREIAAANGEDARGGLSKALDAMFPAVMGIPAKMMDEPSAAGVSAEASVTQATINRRP